MPVVRRADTRRTETPNAVMTTLASPAQGGAAHSLWRVEMRPGQSGPEHVMDAEQIWTVLSGAADVDLDGRTHALAPGDTLIAPAGLPRRITATAPDGLTALVTGTPTARAALPDGTDKGVPPWTA